MRQIVALGIGIVLIALAMILAAGTTSRDTAPRPKAALAIETEIHSTPSRTPRATGTPTVTPTPMHLTATDPDTQQVLAKLFQYPYRGTVIGTSGARVELQRPFSDGDLDRLVVTGDRVMAGRGLHVASGAFAAVMVREKGEYTLKFLRVVLGKGDMSVRLSAAPSGLVVFRFSRGEMSPRAVAPVEHTFVVRPCSETMGTATDVAIESLNEIREWDCY